MAQTAVTRPHARSRLLIDAALALVSSGITLALLSHGGLGASGHAPRRLDALGVVLAVCASLSLLFWRRAPLGAFVASISASVVLMGLGYPGVPPVAATMALYLVAASRDESHPWTRRTTALVVGFGATHVVAFGLGHGQLPLIQLAMAALVWALAWFAGERTRLRRQQLLELEQRAVRAEREAERDRRLAVAEERTRIARDLHDSAAHAINVIAVQAGAARLLSERDPRRAEQALQTIEDVAHQTISEIDEMVHTLRENGASTGAVEPAPGLAALDTLLAHHAAAGLPVTVATEGQRRPLGGAVDQAAYRILQEALTNCARHGGGPAQVEMRFGDRALDLTVTNPLRADATTRINGGHGLVGMHERATLLGGSLEAGRRENRFVVEVALPYGGTAK